MQLFGAMHIVDETHDLLLLTRYDEAAKTSKSLLDKVSWEKFDFGEHIVNYELSQSRLGMPVNKKRLGDLISATLSESVKGCAHYLIGDSSRAKEVFISMIRNDREDRYIIPKWAIFQDERGKSFIEDLIKEIS